ncbi:MAG: hypothetical protein FD180_1497 [Planctomycetota bacterium]|nr:MAG: hypothetical protein FD180_1497 [Planctomycetota bacterium]
MRSEESGKARKVILLALLCASGAAAPVVALRPLPVTVGSAPIAEPVQAASAAPADSATNSSSAAAIEIAVPLETAAVKPADPQPGCTPAELTLNDRLKGFVLG